MEVTVQKLIDRAKAASDVQDDFVTTTQWIDWANVERNLLENTLVRVGYVLREDREVITTDGNIFGQYELTDHPGVQAVLGVYQFDNGRFRRLRPSDLMDGAGNIDVTTGGSANVYRAFQNTNDLVSIHLWPYPPAGQQYWVRVIPAPGDGVDLAALDDTVTYPMGFEERIVLGMARRALAKEETVNVLIERQIAELDRHIEEVAATRIFAAHQAVRNVDRVERGWTTHLPGVPDVSQWYTF